MGLVLIIKTIFKPIKSAWKKFSIATKLYSVVGIMATLIVFELILLHFTMETLSAVRAFVGGEGTWSKSQKDAIYFLELYSTTKDEKYYLSFQSALDIPRSDRIARLELEKPNPNLEIVRSGFIGGQIHPDDVTPMIKLLQRFNWVSYISDALNYWREADRLIIQLESTAEKYRQLIMNDNADRIETMKVANEISAQNKLLTIAEANFSGVLGEGSRRLEKIINFLLICMVVTVEGIGLGLTFFTSRSISDDLLKLNQAAEDIGNGNFTRELVVESRDEIGQLMKAVNKMGSLLNNSYTKLRQSQQELELRVQERTAELEKIANENALLYDETKKAVKMRDDFLSIASHEIRTPLTALHLQLQRTARQLKAKPEVFDINQFETQIKNTIFLSKRLSLLQEELMALTQISVGKLELKLEDVNLSDIVNEAMVQLEDEANRVGSKLILINSNPITVHIDSLRISQVVTNLISNAIKYGEGKNIEISIGKENNQAVISVKDQGLGISSDSQEKIFERFERVNKDEHITGLGLGLYISKQITEAHGGHISLISAPGKGATFKIHLTLS